MAFKLICRQLSAGETLEGHLAAASQQFTEGDACNLIDNGTVQRVDGQTELPSHIFKHLDVLPSVIRPATENLSTTAGEIAQVIPCAELPLEFETELLLANNSKPSIGSTASPAAVVSGSTTTAVVANDATYDSSPTTNDFQGGVVYFPTTGTQHKITGSTYSSPNHTLTFVPPAPRAIASTDTAIVIPFGVGSSPKLAPTTPYLSVSTVVGDNTGGNLVVTKVLLGRLPVSSVWVRFLDINSGLN